MATQAINPNGVEVVTGGQKNILDTLFGPAVENISTLLKEIKEASLLEKEDFKKPGKSKVSITDITGLSAPHSFGFVYLGNIMQGIAGTLGKGLGRMSASIKSISEDLSGEEGTPFDQKAFLAGMALFAAELKNNMPYLDSRLIAKELKEVMIEASGAKNLADLKESGGLVGLVKSAFNAITGATASGGFLAGIKALMSGSKLAVFLANPINTLISGLVLTVVDGIKGFFKSKEWGTSRLGGVIGSALAGTGKGLLAMFKNMGKWALLGATIGMAAGPAGVITGGLVGSIIGSVAGALLNAFGGKEIAKLFDKLGKWVASLPSRLWSNIKEFGLGFWDSLKETRVEYAALGKSLKGKISSAWTSIGEFTSGLINTVTTFFKDTYGNVKGWVSKKWVSLKEGFMGIPSAVGEFFSTAVEKAKEWVPATWNTIKEGFFSIPSVVSTFFLDVTSKAGEWVKGKWVDLNEKFNGIPQSILNFFTGTILKIGEWLNGYWVIIKEAFTKIPGRISGIFIDVVEGIKEWMKDPWGNLKEAFLTLPLSLVTFFVDTGLKVGEWVGEKWTNLKETFGSIPMAVLNFFTSIPGKIGEWIEEKWAGLKEGFGGIAGGIKDFFSRGKKKTEEWGDEETPAIKKSFLSITQGVGSWFENRGIDVEALGKDSSSAIADFASNMFGKAKNWFKKAADDVEEESKKGGILSGVKNFFSGKKEEEETTSQPLGDNHSDTRQSPFKSWRPSYKGKANPSKVEDAIFKFDLEKSAPRGSLFDGNNPVIPDVEDDLYLVASTNPARDSLTESVDRLGELIEQLAIAINSYKPQINTTVAPIQSQGSVLQALLAKG